MEQTYVIAGIAVAVLVFLVVLFRLMWRVAEPNRAGRPTAEGLVGPGGAAP